jgi:hypothetical protein
MTVGGYAWAKMGVDWNGAADSRIRDRLRILSEIEFDSQGKAIIPPYAYSSFPAGGAEDLEVGLKEIVTPDIVAEAKSLLSRMTQNDVTTSAGMTRWGDPNTHPSPQELAFFGRGNRVQIGDHSWHPGKMILIGTNYPARVDLDEGNPYVLQSMMESTADVKAMEQVKVPTRTPLSSDVRPMRTAGQVPVVGRITGVESSISETPGPLWEHSNRVASTPWVGDPIRVGERVAMSPSTTARFGRVYMTFSNEDGARMLGIVDDEGVRFSVFESDISQREPRG